MSLPEPYGAWLEELCGGPLPRERRATCDDCVMCGPDVIGGRPFNDTSRCCTYVPRIPNFMMGRIWADDSLPEGLATVAARFAEGEGLSPLGIEVADADQAAYDAIVDADQFGRSTVLHCPHHLPDGRCGIWRHRNGVCATWFCRHEKGARAQQFWEDVQLLLTELERVIGYYCARKVRWPEGVPNIFEADKKLFACDWGAFDGRALDFYRACAAEFARLDWKAVRAIGDARFDRLCDAVERAYDDLRALPTRLVAGEELELYPQGDGYTQVLAYSATDPIRVPDAVMARLAAFDGRRVLPVLAELKAQGVAVDLDLVAQLAAFEVLVPPEEDA